MSSRAIGGAILMVPTALMIYSIGLSALHDPTFRKVRSIESDWKPVVVPAPLSASAATAGMAATIAPSKPAPARTASVERCHSVMNHQKIEQICVPVTPRQSRT